MLLVKGVGTTIDADIFVEEVTISGGNFDINGDEGNDKINVSNVEIGDDLIAYVNGNGGADTINISDITGNGTLNVDGGVGATVKVYDTTAITIKQNVAAVLDFGENQFIVEGGNYSVDGSVMLNFPSENKTFTINGHTYTAKEYGLTYDDNGVTMFYDGEFDYSNDLKSLTTQQKLIALSMLTATKM